MLPSCFRCTRDGLVLNTLSKLCLNDLISAVSLNLMGSLFTSIQVIQSKYPEKWWLAYSRHDSNFVSQEWTRALEGWLTSLEFADKIVCQIFVRFLFFSIIHQWLSESKQRDSVYLPCRSCSNQWLWVFVTTLTMRVADNNSRFNGMFLLG